MTKLLRDKLYAEQLAGKIVEFPIDVGGQLRFSFEQAETIDYTYSLSRLAAHGEMPVDAIGVHLQVADSEGRLWGATHAVSTSFLVDRLAVAAFKNGGGFTSDPSVRQRFEHSLLVERLVYCDDDRLYRSLNIQGEWVQFIFKYSSLVFDIAEHTSEDGWMATYVLLREGGDYDPGRPYGEIRNADQLPSLIFELDTDGAGILLRAPGAHLTEDGNWLDDGLPRGMVFSRLEGEGVAQPAVTVLK